MKKLTYILISLAMFFVLSTVVSAEESEEHIVTVSTEEELRQAVSDENITTILISGGNRPTRKGTGTVMVLAEPMSVTHDLTIKAFDDNPIIIKVADVFRHMIIGLSNLEPGFTLEFENIILDGGGKGGGILCAGNATIDNAIILNCDSIFGGGIQCYGYNKLTINNSTISGNTAIGSGGGIQCDSGR